MGDIEIIMHAGAMGANQFDDDLDTLLRTFAEKHKQDPGEWAEKYGTDYEDDRVKMSRFCWCEQEVCPLCNGTEPNFRYKTLDFTVSWYKYIGRGVEVNKQLTADEFKQMSEDLLK
jgi:hypothetical protein